jgi:trafficking protein particle complex subunit 12
MVSMIGEPGREDSVLMPLLAISEGRYEDAAQLWRNQENTENDADNVALVKQNLAVAYLYSGQLQKARTLLEELVDAGHSFQSLTVNLATIYELSSDRSKDLKMALAGKIAKQQESVGHAWSRTNVDFKL